MYLIKINQNQSINQLINQNFWGLVTFAYCKVCGQFMAKDESSYSKFTNTKHRTEQNFITTSKSTYCRLPE